VSRFLEVTSIYSTKGETTMKKKLALPVALAMVLSLAACSNNNASSTSSDASSSSAADNTSSAVVEESQASDAGAAGFTEIPIFEDEEIGFMNISAVYFQPVPMTNGNEDIENFNLHLECDVSALQNDLGYGTGDWVPYLTVDYKVTGSDGTDAASGTFMVMSASDGPHYGANIKLDKADTYSLTFTFHSPEENGYLIHTDAETGPGGTFDEFFKDGNLSYTFEGWDYTPQDWN